MKKVVLFCIIFIAVVWLYDLGVNYYDIEGTVYSDEGNVLVLLDKTDNLWEIDNTNTLKVGDKVRITFCTNGTDSERIDDTIERVVIID